MWITSGAASNWGVLRPYSVVAAIHHHHLVFFPITNTLPLPLPLPLPLLPSLTPQRPPFSVPPLRKNTLLIFSFSPCPFAHPLFVAHTAAPPPFPSSFLVAFGFDLVQHYVATSTSVHVHTHKHIHTRYLPVAAVCVLACAFCREGRELRSFVRVCMSIRTRLCGNMAAAQPVSITGDRLTRIGRYLAGWSSGWAGPSRYQVSRSAANDARWGRDLVLFQAVVGEMLTDSG